MKRRRRTFERLEDRRMLSGTHIVLHDMDVVLGPESDQQYVWSEGMQEDSFTYPSPAGPVEVTILSDETPDYTLDEDTVLVVDAANGVSGGLPGVVLVAGPTHGVMMLDDDGSFILAPDADWFGTDQFLHSRDGLTFLTRVLVVGVNDAPMAVDDAVDGVEDTPLRIDVLANDSDIDLGDVLSIESFTQPDNGVVTHDDGILTYMPNADFNGTDTFTYTASDGTGGLGTATVTIEVSAVNDAPVATADTYSTRVGEALGVNTAIGLLVNDSDVDGDLIAGTTVISEPGHGVVTVTDTGAFLYIPDAEYTGEDSFQYKASDGELWSEFATVTITIIASNLPIVRSEVYLSGPGGISVDAAMGVLANDSTGAGELRATILTAPLHGLMVLAADGSFTYTPDVGFAGADPFTYRATDADGLFGEVRSAFWVEATLIGDGSPSSGGADRSPPALGGGPITNDPWSSWLVQTETFPPLNVVHPPVTEAWKSAYEAYFYAKAQEPNWEPIVPLEYVDAALQQGV